MDTSFLSAPDESLINRIQLRILIPASDMSVWRWTRDLGFPAAVKIQNRNYWRLGEVRRWLAEREQAGAA